MALVEPYNDLKACSQHVGCHSLCKFFWVDGTVGQGGVLRPQSIVTASCSVRT
jgi:hypothetical protein